MMFEEAFVCNNLKAWVVSKKASGFLMISHARPKYGDGQVAMGRKTPWTEVSSGWEKGRGHCEAPWPRNWCGWVCIAQRWGAHGHDQELSKEYTIGRICLHLVSSVASPSKRLSTGHASAWCLHVEFWDVQSTRHSYLIPYKHALAKHQSDYHSFSVSNLDLRLRGHLLQQKQMFCFVEKPHIRHLGEKLPHMADNFHSLFPQQILRLAAPAGS